MVRAAKANAKLYRAYLMKEQLRLAIKKKGLLVLAMLDGWLDWAQRCRIPAFVEFGRKIRKNIAGIEAAMLNNLSNALMLRQTRAPDRTRSARPRWLVPAATRSSSRLIDPRIKQESPN